MEQLRRRQFRLRNHKTSEMEQLGRRKYNQRYHMTLKEGSGRKKKRELMNMKRWRLFHHQTKRYPRYNI
jgi:NADPH-dependent 7-cyano-7-deazaguanine reductase QueF-like protein